MAEQVQGQFGYQTVQLIKTQPLGIGSYGAVYKAKCDDLPCAAKILHPTFFQFNDPGAMTVMRRFKQECTFLGAVRHPNIVQYLGSYRDPDTQLPVLLMELMDESLTQFLERSQKPLPYHVQVNLCYDITLALAYLHSNDTIHRDLSSNNVLLIGGRRAKLTDFGMMKLFNVSTTINQLTMCPGAQVYMSPEALHDPPAYMNKLDCFSFGVLAIQIITRQFPDPGPLTKTIQDPHYPLGRLQVVVPETERRKSHIDLIISTHPLLPIATACLSYNEEDRPSAQELCHRLAALKETPQYGGSVQQAQETNTPALSTTARQELEPVTQEKELRTQQVQQTHHLLEKQLRKLNQQLAASEQVAAQLREENQQLQQELWESLAAKDGFLQQSLATQKEELKLSWKTCKPAPCPMRRGSAIVHGRMAFFRSGGNSQVRIYHSDSEEWSTLPECPRDRFTLTLINGLVTAVGGEQSCRTTNTLLSVVGQGDKRMWVEHFPPMPLKCWTPAVVCSGKVLVVAGGWGEGYTRLDTVQVMDTDALQWSTASSLPHPLVEASAAVCGDSVYLVGGYCLHNTTNTVITCSLNVLQSHATEAKLSLAQDHQVWHTITDLPVVRSTCVALNGQLLAVGGYSDLDKRNTNTILRYNPETNSWEVLSRMATLRSECLVAVLPGNRLMVVGGTNETPGFLEEVEISTVQ